MPSNLFGSKREAATSSAPSGNGGGLPITKDLGLPDYSNVPSKYMAGLKQGSTSSQSPKKGLEIGSLDTIEE